MASKSCGATGAERQASDKKEWKVEGKQNYGDISLKKSLPALRRGGWDEGLGKVGLGRGEDSNFGQDLLRAISRLALHCHTARARGGARGRTA